METVFDNFNSSKGWSNFSTNEKRTPFTFVCLMAEGLSNSLGYYQHISNECVCTNDSKIYHEYVSIW